MRTRQLKDAPLTSATGTPGANWTYTYDAENHLISASGPRGQGFTFTYDGLGRLVAYTPFAGSLVRFYYAGSQRIEECDVNNSVQQDYMFDAPGSDQILARQGVYGVQWYQYDLMGNVSHLSDNNGNVVEMYLYDAWGTPAVYDASGNARTGAARTTTGICSREGRRMSGMQWQGCIIAGRGSMSRRMGGGCSPIRLGRRAG